MPEWSNAKIMSLQKFTKSCLMTLTMRVHEVYVPLYTTHGSRGRPQKTHSRISKVLLLFPTFKHYTVLRPDPIPPKAQCNTTGTKKIQLQTTTHMQTSNLPIIRHNRMCARRHVHEFVWFVSFFSQPASFSEKSAKNTSGTKNVEAIYFSGNGKLHSSIQARHIDEV